MYDVQGRRTALTKLVAGSAAIRAALASLAASAEDSGPGAEKGNKHGKKRGLPRQIWKGKLRNIVYTRADDGDPDHYIITANGVKDGTLHHMAADRKVTMYNQRLAHFIDKKSGGKLHGDQTMRFGGINWRIYGVDYDAKTNT
ncbi:MAG: hypothetical protein ACR2J8_11185, partial [Thermomicrobiales bacterium]